MDVLDALASSTSELSKIFRVNVAVGDLGGGLHRHDLVRRFLRRPVSEANLPGEDVIEEFGSTRYPALLVDTGDVLSHRLVTIVLDVRDFRAG